MIVAIWIAGNAFLLTRPFDPYPFILLNLAFSTQAAYAAPLILLAGNRASLRDRLTLEHAAEETDIEEEQNKRLLTGNTEILKQVAGLEQRILELKSRSSRPSKDAAGHHRDPIQPGRPIPTARLNRHYAADMKKRRPWNGVAAVGVWDQTDAGCSVRRAVSGRDLVAELRERMGQGLALDRRARLVRLRQKAREVASVVVENDVVSLPVSL